MRLRVRVPGVVMPRLSARVSNRTLQRLTIFSVTRTLHPEHVPARSPS